MYKEENKNDKWKEQWLRIQRFYKKVKNIKEECPKDYTDEDCLDVIYSFFMNCYHLKDWLNKSHTELKSKIEQLFDKSDGIECFKVCADFVNGLKHLEADIRTRIDKNTEVNTQSVRVQSSVNLVDLVNKYNETGKIQVVKGHDIKTNYDWTIKSGEKIYNIFTLVDQCMIEWENFLKSNNL